MKADMAEFSLQEMWWNKPSRTESQLPALQLGVQIVQRKAQQDLQERDLANDIARTSLMREELLAKQRIQMQVTAGNAEVAATISEITDWSDPAQVARVWRTASKYPMLPESKAVLGAQHMHESAVAAKTRALNIESLIESRQDRAEYNAKRLELQELLQDSNIDVNDSRVLKANAELNMMEREMAVREGNLELRGVELEQKGKRLSLRDAAAYKNELSALDREEKDVLGKTFDATDAAAKRKLYNLKRRGLVEKFYGKQEAPPAATTREEKLKVIREGLSPPPPPPGVTLPEPVAPGGTNIRRQGGNLFQQQPDGTWKFLGPAQ